MAQGEISEADIPTIRLGATPSRLISDPPSLSPIFKPDALPVATLPIFPGLRQAPNMLTCIFGACGLVIPSGLVHIQWLDENVSLSKISTNKGLFILRTDQSWTKIVDRQHIANKSKHSSSAFSMLPKSGNEELRNECLKINADNYLNTVFTPLFLSFYPFLLSAHVSAWRQYRIKH